MGKPQRKHESQSLTDKIVSLPGPLLVIGAGGFVGNNLYRSLRSVRSDVYGTYSQNSSWRVQEINCPNLFETQLNEPDALHALFHRTVPATVFNTACHGGYPFQRSIPHIVRSNILLPAMCLETMDLHFPDTLFIQFGSSSEYGFHSESPSEGDLPQPNSAYSVSKLCAAHWIEYYGKVRGLNCLNLRLYSVFGPWEEPSRLIPRLIQKGLQGQYPPLADPRTARDLIYVEDAVEAAVDAALHLNPNTRGRSFNIGSGTQSTLRELADWSGTHFKLKELPPFHLHPGRHWDQQKWVADPSSAMELLQWQPRHALTEGLQKTVEWYQSRQGLSLAPSREEKSLDIVVACYNDGPGLVELHQRLRETLESNGVNYRILFVNDGSRDNTEEILREITESDPRVMGITHSRNFGSQAAFKSGMEASHGDGCVLMDGDLQDPPELLSQFIQEWKKGYEVVFGERTSREEASILSLMRSLFYRIFHWSTETGAPQNAGDFGLLDRKAKEALLQCPERDLFWRGLRSYIGFKQKGVPYHRPQRSHGKSSNDFMNNLAWATKGWFSFGHRFENWHFAWGLLSLALLLPMGFLLGRTRSPFVVTLALSWIGFTTVGLMIAIQRISKIFDEVKRRPTYIRKSFIRDGQILPWDEHGND